MVLSVPVAILKSLHNSFIEEEPVETLADRYVRLRTEMTMLRSGAAISVAADAVEAELPSCDVVLVSTSDEGAALAAVCASRRSRDTSWMKVNLLAAEPIEDAATVVVIEPIDAGAAWRQAVDRAYPGARVVILADIARVHAVAA
jgi:hypothetical protein